MNKFETGTSRRRPRRRAAPVVLVAVTALWLAGCSSTAAQSDPATTAPARTTTTIYTFEGHSVSGQAHMVCAAEASVDLAEALAVKTSTAPVPGWSDGAYTCTYTYADGAHFVLSVHDLASDAAARSAFDTLAHTLGRSNQPINLGAGQAFLTPAGNAVVQKDEHILVVDVSGVPASWLDPPNDHAQVATAVATTIMGCWTGG